MLGVTGIIFTTSKNVFSLGIVEIGEPELWSYVLKAQTAAASCRRTNTHT
jgi:hypothetical protein